MKRRTFLASLGAVPAVPVELSRGQPGSLSIRKVEVLQLEGKLTALALRPYQHQVQPLHIYPEFRPQPISGPTELIEANRTYRALYLRISTTDDVFGLYGPIDPEAAIVVDRQLRPFLEGKDPLAGEALWDQMFRSNRHSRRGHFMMAISAVDNTLWDLRGRYYNAPVYRLLGGPTRQRVRVYGSCLGFSVDPKAAAQKAAELAREGFVLQKWFLAYGPGDGAAGLEQNVALVRELWQAVGSEVDLMFDAFMGWDLNYALGWIRQVEAYRPRWIEEPFHADKVSSFVELRRKTSIPVASGEHLYNRWEVLEYLRAGALDVVQADPEWCGGVSELVKICALASACDAHVVPHGHSLHAALHVVASQSPMTCPFGEYLINKMRTYYHFEKQPLKVSNGEISLPHRPGFGIELDESKIERQQVVHW